MHEAQTVYISATATTLMGVLLSVRALSMHHKTRGKMLNRNFIKLYDSQQ